MAKYFIVILGLVGLVLFQGFRFLDATPSSDESEARIEIPQGASFREVTERLGAEGLISSRFSFRLLGKLTQSEAKIKPGEYRLHRAMRPMDLLNKLVRGEVLQYPIVIPEGLSSRQIAQIFDSAGLVKADTFLQWVRDPDFIRTLGFEGDSLEGYLFPETYHFSKQAAPQQIVTRIVGQFKAIYDAAFQERAKELGMSQREVVTLASIIEKETSAPQERRSVSAVFHNRLKINMRLQSDPTVIFSVDEFDGNLTRAHLFNDSPYNTYRVSGLPPGPIANPGREAIDAALYPEAIDYLYFVSKNNGTHYFSKTLEEHNAAVRKYQIERQQEAAVPTQDKKADGSKRQ